MNLHLRTIRIGLKTLLSMKSLDRVALIGMALCLVAATPALGQSPTSAVVINEIMYHPPEDRDDLQYLELFNAGAAAVDLSGWSFTKGVAFVFPKGFELPAGAYTILCRDKAAFQSFYGMNVAIAGVFTGRLSHNGEQLQLVEAGGQEIELVNYSDQAPWPLGCDGYGSSLERISPKVSALDSHNWASSQSKSRNRSGGTPGYRNSVFSDVPLPRIADVTIGKAEANEPVSIQVTVDDSSGVDSVILAWCVVADGRVSQWSDLPMQLNSGDSKKGIYWSNIPAQPQHRLVRFKIRVRNEAGAARISPSSHEPRPAYSYSTFVNQNDARVPYLQIFPLNALRPAAPPPFSGRQRSGRADAEEVPDRMVSGGSVVVYTPEGGGPVQVFDHVQVRPRRGGWKVHFLKDQPLDGMTGINLIFEQSPRWILSEPLAYELYRRAGVPAPLTQHVRLWLDRQPLGYHLLVEQPNKSFLRRNSRDEDGNLYKLLWYGEGVIGQHEKKINAHTGHGDLVRLIESLRRSAGPAQWQLIKEQFDVSEVASYFAVNMCIQNWDGFFNNYYVYHDLRPGGKWEMFPWDEDKTWGDYDGASSRYDWYEMPLHFGMNEQRANSRSLFGGGPFGGHTSWWRPPGWFSGPLLANADFRKHFLQRLRGICDTIFTPEKLDPVINRMENRLLDEVRYRAELTGENPESAIRNFRNDIESFRRQVINRRKFLLNELEASK